MWRLSLVALAGCNSLLGVHSFDADGATADVLDPTDVFVPSDAPVCVGSAHAPLHQCGIDDNTTLTISSPFSTTTCPGGARITDSTPPRCVIFAHAIAQPETLIVTGDADLVLFAIDTITLGTLDGSSTKSDGGPGASTSCKGGDGSGGGGGAGGSFLSRGGAGGDGANGGNGGNASSGIDTGVFQPGCAGGASGVGIAGSSDGGRGGGAIYLAANHQVVITSRVLANGAPGRGGNPRTGGGGGGTGGSIFIDAPAITCQTTPCMIANGAGGGGGGGAQLSGQDGSTPSTNGSSATGGAGSSGSMSGGRGGDGNNNLGDAQPGAKAFSGNQNNSGGGGGGGAGQIVIFGGAVLPLGGSVPTAKSGG